MEVKTEVKTFLVEFKCENCEEGKLIKGQSGYSNSAGTFWPHTCTSCNHTETFKNKSYPHYSYERI